MGERFVVAKKRGGTRQRGALRSESTITPSLGAHHPILNAEAALGDFFDDVDAVMRHNLTDPLDEECHGSAVLRQRRGFTLFDDFERAGVRVLERRITASYARKHRLKWTRQDIGRIRGRIQDEVARYEFGLLPAIPISFTDVGRFGDADEHERGRRILGLVPDSMSETADFLAEEHGIVVNGIATALDRFRYPYSEYLPHLSLAKVYRDVEPAKIKKVVENLRDLLPLQVELQPLTFVSEQEV